MSASFDPRDFEGYAAASAFPEMERAAKAAYSSKARAAEAQASIMDYVVGELANLKLAQQGQQQEQQQGNANTQAVASMSPMQGMAYAHMASKVLQTIVADVVHVES